MESIELKYIRGKISALEYWEHKLPRSAFSEQCAGCMECEDHLRSALDKGFWSLDSLSRSDPFWDKTNGLATEFKLAAFAECKIARGEELVDSAWLLIAISLRNCSDHLIPLPWKILFTAGAFDAELAVCTAWNMSAYWLDRNIGRLATLSKTLKAEHLVLDALNSLAQPGSEQALWIQEVRIAMAAT